MPSKSLLFFDTETTGLPRSWRAPVEDLDNWPRMVELAWLQYDEFGQAVEERSAIIRPDGFTVPDDAARVHGITTEVAIADGEPLDVVLSAFAAAVDRSGALIAHNIDFDDKIVGAEFLRTGVANAFFGCERFCTMKATTTLCGIPGRYGFKWPTLAELYQHVFGRPFHDAHRAGPDVQACADCFFEIRRRRLIALPPPLAGVSLS